MASKAPKIKIHTSGRTYLSTLSPDSADYPKSLKLPEAEVSKLGRGFQYRMEVTPTQLGKLVDFLRKQQEIKLAKGVTPEVREDGYAIKYDVEKLEKVLAEVQAAGSDDDSE